MRAAVAAVLAATVMVGCGKKGPPLPPLIKLPAAPELKATRRGSTVDVEVTVPNANTDGTRPANVERVDVYGFTGSAAVADADLLKEGARVGTLPVKAPEDPTDTAEPGESEEAVAPPTGTGLDQGAVAHIEEQLDSAIAAGSEARTAAGRPLLGPQAGGTSRVYVGVGVNKKGRPGRVSARVTVPLGVAPPPPASPTVSYTETAITVAWRAPAAPVAVAPAADVLPSHPIGAAPPATAFNVYDATTGTLLTRSPIAGTHFDDTRIAWGEKRCYAVRSVSALGALTVESDASPTVCDTLVDTFPPAAPKGLHVIATNGMMNLIWDPNTETDLAGYLVLRGVAPAERLEPITPMPITEPMFTDPVQPGVRYAYAVRAVDKAGNQSAPSPRQEETAR